MLKLYRSILLVVLILPFQSVIAQKKDKSDKEIKVNTRFENGIIRGGYKSGIWNYYDKPGEISLTVDYNTGQIPYLKKDSAGVYVIEKSGVWTQSNLDIQPRYIGSMAEFYIILMRNIRYPFQARNNKTMGTVYVTFEVDTTGKASNFSIAKNIGDNCAEEVIRVLQLVPNMWIVASKDGEHYKSRFMIPVTFTSYRTENEPPPNPDAHLPMATLFEEVVIKIYPVIKN